MPFISTDILQQMLCFCSRNSLEKLQVIDKQFNSIITNYFSSSPYRLIYHFSVNCSFNGLLCNINAYMNDSYPIKDSLDKLLTYLKPSTRAKTSYLVVNTECLENNCIRKMIQQLALIAHLWLNGKLELELNGMTNPDKNTVLTEKLLLSLLTAPTQLFQCKIAIFSAYFTSFLASYPFYQCKQLYRCDKVVFKNLSGIQESMLKYLHELNKTRKLRTVPLNVSIYMGSFGLDRFVEKLKEMFLSATQICPYFLTCADTYFEEAEGLEDFCMYNLVTQETLCLETFSLGSNETYDFITDKRVFCDKDDYVEDPADSRKMVYKLKRTIV